MEYLIIILLIYLIINVIYYLTFSIASRASGATENPAEHGKENKIAVLIPAYQEDAVIVDTALQATKHDYPKNKFDVYIIADQLQASTLMKLDRLKVRVVEVSFEKSSKTKAINATLAQMDPYDLAVVLDADNVMAPDFLKVVNQAYNQGAVAIQGQRVAKNEENSLARLDAISEEINNNIFRKGHQNLGLSSALIGSGMAFDFHLFKRHMADIKALGGFDKELELSLLKSKVRIKYSPNAIVYDEKVSDSKSFSNQRTRWIAAQIRFGVRFFGSGLTELFTHGNIDYSNKVLQFILLPRLILLGCLTLMSAVCLLISKALFLIAFATLVVCGFTLLLATPTKHFASDILCLFLSLPMLFFRMVLAFGGYKKAKTNFLHTAHKTKVAS